jgi:hypothetical protein
MAAVRLTIVLGVTLAALAVGCGSNNNGGQQPDRLATTEATAPATATSPADAKPRAGRLLDQWSDTLLTTLLAAQARSKAAQAADQNAYNKADAQLRPGLRKVKRFASQGRLVMSRFRTGSVSKAVVADGDAWQEWAVALLRPGDVSLTAARKIADLATTAFARHERAYRAAGKQPPPAFQRRADQR